jgi:hypothetical protein
MKANPFAWTDCLGVIDRRDVVFPVDAECTHVNFFSKVPLCAVHTWITFPVRIGKLD